MRRTASAEPVVPWRQPPRPDRLEALGPQRPLLDVVEPIRNRSRRPGQQQVGHARIAGQQGAVHVGPDHTPRACPLGAVTLTAPLPTPADARAPSGATPGPSRVIGRVVLEPRSASRAPAGFDDPFPHRGEAGTATSSPTARRPGPFTVTMYEQPQLPDGVARRLRETTGRSPDSPRTRPGPPHRRRPRRRAPRRADAPPTGTWGPYLTATEAVDVRAGRKGLVGECAWTELDREDVTATRAARPASTRPLPLSPYVPSRSRVHDDHPQGRGPRRSRPGRPGVGPWGRTRR